ncbi:hypothetical protein LNP05_11890 [Klebsiella pneumoniae subsp. pneumoniae]|nr:hypothetical protein [Klebsiella pneumoniae subsp. pneumoniae]
MVAGDFNDWRQQANQPLKAQAGLEEIFTRARGRPARTFPVSFPLLRHRPHLRQERPRQSPEGAGP